MRTMTVALFTTRDYEALPEGFPAQLIERYAPAAPAGLAADVDWTGWPDRFDRGGLLFHGDNKEVLAHLLANGFRGKVERSSAPLLLWLSARPRFVIPVLSAVLLIGGLASPPAIGVPLLALLVLLVGWLSYLSWPVVEGFQRFVRVGTIGLVLAAIVGKLTA